MPLLDPVLSSPIVLWVTPLPEPALRAAVAPPPVQTAWLEGAKCPGERELLAEAGRALALPDWYGRNWDALADCLSGLPGRTLLMVFDAEQVLADAPDRFAVLVDVLRSARAPGPVAPFQAVFVAGPGAADGLAVRIGGPVGRLGPA